MIGPNHANDINLNIVRDNTLQTSLDVKQNEASKLATAHAFAG